MSVDTSFDIYMVKKGRWSQHERLTSGQEAYAFKLANHLEAQVQVPVRVIREDYNTHTDVTHAALVRDTQYITENVRSPEQADLTSRFFLVGLNSIGTGAVLASILFLFIVFARGSGIDVPGNAVSFFMLIGFAIGFLSGAWIMFRVFVPQDLLRWMAKSDQARSGAVYLLTGVGSPPPTLETASDEDESEPERTPSAETENEPEGADSDGFDSATVTVSSTEEGGEEEDPLDDGLQDDLQPEPESEADDLRTAALVSLLGDKIKQLSAFAAICNEILREEHGELEPFMRFGLNLYLAGAADGLTETDDLPDQHKAALLIPVLESVGTSTELAKSFVDRLPSSAERPRFKTLMDAGWAGLQRMQENGDLPADLLDVIAAWGDPEARAQRPSDVAFMVTDIVGSTQLTQKYGDAKAQKLIRAHNSIVRSTIRDGNGEEIKHTGDGILATFNAAEDLIRAAVQVQQFVFDNNRNEEELQLFVRVGIHVGEAVLEEGDYYGSGVNMVEAVCSAADEGEILASKAVFDACPDQSSDFTELDAKTLKGMSKSHVLFRLKWEPNFRYRKTEVKYRQIGSLNA